VSSRFLTKNLTTRGKNYDGTGLGDSRDGAPSDSGRRKKGLGGEKAAMGLKERFKRFPSCPIKSSLTKLKGESSIEVHPSRIPYMEKKK